MPTACWTVPAHPQQVRQLRSAVVTFAAEHGVLDPPINDLKIAVSEAMTNAVVHAYHQEETGEIDVSVTIDRPSNKVVVVVADHGTGMVPRADSPGIGIGLPLIGNLVTDMDVRTPAEGKGTEVHMTFDIPMVD